VTAAALGSRITELIAELVLVVVAAVVPPLFLLGLGYRLWRWVRTPDEQTARKQEARRQQLKRTVRRLATDVPLHSSLEAPEDLSDPPLNDGGLCDE